MDVTMDVTAAGRDKWHPFLALLFALICVLLAQQPGPCPHGHGLTEGYKAGPLTEGYLILSQ